ncbi:hypothetical protein [uncultured Fibrobacter sp.]|uniref:hypothetical protein n=1 Tax=uncultured Fibrobacter sp. TaxID=261512 RepID=UPI0025E8684B|nr:hypothetical protein [uncultured Fibrobacter sp.]
MILCVFTFLLGCEQKDETVKLSTAGTKANSAAPAKPVSLTTYSVMDSARLNEFFELDEWWRKIDKEFNAKIDKVLNDVRKMKNNERNNDDKEISYKVCFSNIDGFVVKHPCSLDSALLVSIVKKLNFSDSAKALKIEIDFIAYSNSNEYADYSEMYLNEDGSIETSCLSKDGKKCDDLYAHVSVYKKIFPENVLAELSPNRHREPFNIHIDESNFTENFKINDFLSSIYEERLERRYHMPQRKHQMNQKDSLIPFEMCYENGFATPCNLTKKDYFRIKKAIEKERDTLVAVTYQRCFMMNDFALDGMSSKHYCNSKDGKHCSELSALVRRNDNATPNYGWLILYRFDLKDFSYTIEELSHGDPMWIDYDELYKKDGSYIGREKKRH